MCHINLRFTYLLTDRPQCIAEYYYRAMYYTAKRGLAITHRPSVCPSVCL